MLAHVAELMGYLGNVQPTRDVGGGEWEARGGF
jgi:hypothetical protein